MDNSSTTETHRSLPNVLSTMNPYYIGSNENTSSSLVNPPLNGSNFYSWKRAMEIAIGAKNKIGFVNGTLICPPTDDPWFSAWVQCNLIVMSLIINSVSIEIGQSILYVDTAAKIWRELNERFSQSHEARIYELHKEIHSLTKRDLSVATYFTKIETLWNSISVLIHIPRCNCGGTTQCTCRFMEAIISREQMVFKMIFLMGLGDEFANVRSQVLMTKHMPAINEIYVMVIQEEKQKSLMVASNAMQNMALATQPKSFSYQRASVKCSFCGGTGHIKDKCYKLHGFPPGWKPKSRNNGPY